MRPPGFVSRRAAMCPKRNLGELLVEAELGRSMLTRRKTAASVAGHSTVHWSAAPVSNTECSSSRTQRQHRITTYSRTELTLVTPRSLR